MPKQIQGSQHDFSFGEVDVDLKRCDDHPARKGGLRQMSNMRIHNSGTIQNRPGRSALFPAANKARIEELTLSPGNDFKIAFGFAGGTGTIGIVNSAGTVVATFTTKGSGGALPWTLATVKKIVYVSIGLQIFITFPGMRPQIIAWDGAATWTISDYIELVYGSQKRTPFYRITAGGVLLVPSATSGAITLTASAPIFTAAHVGTRIRWVGRQILITAVTAPPNAVCSALVEETLNTSLVLLCASDPRSQFSVGDVVIGATTNAKGIVSSINSSALHVVLQSGVLFASGSDPNEIIAGPAGSMDIVATGTTIISPESTIDWDEEVMNDLRGYPASCFADQFRLGFCNFPSVPGGISWSAINTPNDIYVNATSADGGMFEIAPAKVQVQFVVPGPESSEFVFCDKKLYYIPISPTNPLRSGSVQFTLLSGDGCAPVQPRLAQEAILYVNAGQNTVMAVIATGAYTRPYNTKNLTDLHAHLFNSIQAIACPSADGTFNERYAYVLNGDGSITIGKYDPGSLQTNQPVIGWGPWSGVGDVSWIAAWAADVLFTTAYFGATICEVLDDTQYLDAALPVNALPAAFTPPAGFGPLWWIPSQSVSLMDQGTRSMGTYQIDINGNIIPQGLGGENLAIASLVAGQPWTAIVEPFAPDASSGADLKQRMELRQFSKFAVYVINSTGFLIASLFSAKQTSTTPPLGTIMSQYRFPTYITGDDATLPPTLRETVGSWTPSGSSYDPRAAIIKDTPGPLLIAEIGTEISI